MPYILTYFNETKTDVREAKAWYRKRQAGLEKRFADAIKTAILNLQQQPFSYAVRYNNIRIAHPKTFPFGIHFYIDETNGQIVIVAVIHNKRHPNIAQKRL